MTRSLLFLGNKLFRNVSQMVSTCGIKKQTTISKPIRTLSNLQAEQYNYKEISLNMDVYIKLNHVQSHLSMWGNAFNSNLSDVIVLICGNPGFVGFYSEFADLLHKSTGLTVCVVGHAGHSVVPDKKSMLLQGQEHLFNLNGQVEHKLDLVCNYIDKQSKLHLIGHSVGAWMILEIFHKCPSLLHRVSSVNFLFPLLQKMSETTKGKNHVRKHLKTSVVFYTLLSYLPPIFTKIIFWFYQYFAQLPGKFRKLYLENAHPQILEKVYYLADDETLHIKNLDTEMLNKIKHLTNVIYGNNDGWAPLHFIEDLKQFTPEMQMTKVNYAHAFVLESAKPVEKMVSNFIKTKISM